MMAGGWDEEGLQREEHDTHRAAIGGYEKFADGIGSLIKLTF